MRISSQQLHIQGIRSITNQQNQLADSQLKLASGKRVLTPSDDPIASSQIISLRQQVANSERYNLNADAARSRLEIEDSLLEGITTVIQRVRELQIQASNDSIGEQGRASITQELKQRLEEAKGLMNTQDANGNYIFSGYQNNVQPFTQNNSGQFIYNGDAGQRFVEVGEGLQVAVTDSGFHLFENIRTGNGEFTVKDTGATNTGAGAIGETSVFDQAAYVKDTYTLTFVTNSSGELAYQVVGANSGQLIPALPSVTPAAAPAYQDGQAIQFNGIQLEVTGTPVAGDDFQVAPSQGQNLLTTISNLITTLDVPEANSTQLAAMRTQLNQGLGELDQALDNVILTRTEIGARLNAIDSATEVNNDFILNSQSTISNLQDLDYSEAVGQFEAQSVALQISQQTFLRIRNLNLFSFLG